MTCTHLAKTSPRRTPKKRGRPRKSRLSVSGSSAGRRKKSSVDIEARTVHELKRSPRRVKKWEELDSSDLVSPYYEYEKGDFIWARWDTARGRSWWPAVIEPEPGSEYWREITSEKGAVWNFYVRFFDGLDTRMKLRFDAIRKLDWEKRHELVPEGRWDNDERGCVLAALRELEIWGASTCPPGTSNIECGEFVWCRMYPYPWWPAQVNVNSETGHWKSENGRMIWVEFLNSYDELGNKDGWWMTHTSVLKLDAEKTQMFMPPKSNEYFGAIVGALSIVTEDLEKQRLRKRKRTEEERKKKEMEERKRRKKIGALSVKEARKKVKDCEKKSLQIQNQVTADENEIARLERRILELERCVEDKLKTRSVHLEKLENSEAERKLAYQEFYRAVAEANCTEVHDEELINDVASPKKISIADAKRKWSMSVQSKVTDIKTLSMDHEVHSRDLELYQIVWVKTGDRNWGWFPAFIDVSPENQWVKVTETVTVVHITVLNEEWDAKWTSLQDLRRFDFAEVNELLSPLDSFEREGVESAVADAREICQSVSCGMSRYEVGSYVWARLRGLRWWPAQVIETDRSNQSWTNKVYVRFFQAEGSSDFKACTSLPPARLRPLHEGNCEQYKPEQHLIETDSSGMLKRIADACEDVKEILFQNGILELSNESLMENETTLDCFDNAEALICSFLDSPTSPEDVTDDGSGSSVRLDSPDSSVDSLLNLGSPITDSGSSRVKNATLFDQRCKNDKLVEEETNRAMLLLHR